MLFVAPLEIFTGNERRQLVPLQEDRVKCIQDLTLACAGSDATDCVLSTVSPPEGRVGLPADVAAAYPTACA